MIRVLETLYEHVVDIHLHCASYQLLEDFIDHLVEGDSDIIQPEGHYFVAVDGTTSVEGNLALILWLYLDLIISGVGIHEAEKFMTRSCVDHLVYAR